MKTVALSLSSPKLVPIILTNYSPYDVIYIGSNSFIYGVLVSRYYKV
jgi:hypothetical protein